MPKPDCPDVLGAITSARTVFYDQLQCAIGVFPQDAVLNQPVELLVLLQSAVDKPIDLTIKIYVPLKDRAGNELKFDLPAESFRRRLEPLEVGVVHLPVYVKEPTPSGQSYPVVVEFLFLPDGNAKVIRPSTGGRPPTLLSASPFHLTVLRDVSFTAIVRRPGQLATTMNIVPGKFPLATDEVLPKYDTLWTTRVLAEEQQALEEIKPRARQFSNSLTTPNILVPLRNLTIDKFDAIDMPLHGAEATMIAKMLTYVVDDGLELEEGFSLEGARWFRELCQLMVADPGITSRPGPMFEQLFPAVVYDAVLVGLAICHTFLNIDVGNSAEQRGYAEEIRETLTGQRETSLNYVYLPLVMAGITLNSRVTTRDEPVAENIHQMKEAVRGRKALAGGGHNEIFELTETLIERAQN